MTVTLHGTNDVAVIGGVSTGDVTEDLAVVADHISTSGALTIADPDQGQSSFVAQAGAPGSSGFGSFSLDTAGNWTYTADNTQAAIQQLGAGQSLTDSFTATSLDGSASQLVTVTIHGTNDAPVAQAQTVQVNEDGAIINGQVTAVDPDNVSSALNFGLVGTNGGAQHGTVSLNSDGTFSYTPNADYNGPDSFSFGVTDQSQSSALVNGLGGTSDFGEGSLSQGDTVQQSVDLTSVFGASGINFFGHQLHLGHRL